VTLENGVHAVIGAACAYEVFALTTRKVPTLSKICRHSKSFELLLLGTLVVHFHMERAERKLFDKVDKKGMYVPV